MIAVYIGDNKIIFPNLPGTGTFNIGLFTIGGSSLGEVTPAIGDFLVAIPKGPSLTYRQYINEYLTRRLYSFQKKTPWSIAYSLCSNTFERTIHMITETR